MGLLACTDGDLEGMCLDLGTFEQLWVGFVWIWRALGGIWPDLGTFDQL